jgi:hypothetical protein
VALVAVPVLALAFAGCGGDDETAYCVDEQDRIVENRYCDEDARDGNPAGAFFWYYGGSLAGGRLAPGTKITGGDRVAASNVQENIRRGGFGSSSTRASGVGRAVSASSGG